MAFLNKPVCDGCGIEKRETNHWFCIKADEMGFRTWPWQYVKNPKGYGHYCGAACATKRFAQWMNEQVSGGERNGISESR